MGGNDVDRDGTDPAVSPPEASQFDRIAEVEVQSLTLDLATPISDAKVFTGRQRPLTEIPILAVHLRTGDGLEGFGFSYSKRAGGPGQYAHAVELIEHYLDEDPNDIARLWDRAVWAGASVGRSGMATQSIAAFDIALWDLKAKRAQLPLAKLLGSYRDAVPCYNTSGGFLSSSVDEITQRALASLEQGIGGIKIKVGQPDAKSDLDRVNAVREAIGPDTPLMVDANQQWDRATARWMGRRLDDLGLVWIEEPLDAYDADGHADLTRRLDTPIATGEMLTSIDEHVRLMDASSVTYLQPDAPRVGGITPFRTIMTLAQRAGLALAPHYVMEIHVHLAATYPGTVWVEHFDWLEPLFRDRLHVRDGRMVVPDRPGLGLTLSDRAQALTTAREVRRSNR